MPQISSGNATIDARLEQLLASGFNFTLLSVPFKTQLKFVAAVTVTGSGAWTVFEGPAELSRPFELRAQVRLAIDDSGRYQLRFTLPQFEQLVLKEVVPRLGAASKTLYEQLVRPYVASYRNCTVILASDVGDDPKRGTILAGINFYTDVALGDVEPTRGLCRAFPAAGLDKRRLVLHLGCIANPAFTFVVEGISVVSAELGTSAIVLDKIALRVDQDSSSLAASAAANVTMRVGGETLLFIGALGVDSSGATMISGLLDAVDGAWKDPFGARGLTITRLGVQLMATAAFPYIGVGLTGGVRFGNNKAQAKIALLYDPSAPDKSVLHLACDQPFDLQALLAGVVDPKHLPPDLFRLSIDDFLIYISPNGGVIAGIDYAPGFALRGAVDLWGLRANVDGRLSYADGGYLRGAMSPLRYPGNALLVDIQGDPGKGPTIDLDFNAVRRGGRAVGALKIVGLYNHTFEAAVDSQRLFLALGKTQLGIYSGGSLELRKNRVTLTSDLAFSADLDIDLGVTRVRFNADVAAGYRGTADPAALGQQVSYAFDACGTRIALDADAGQLRFTEVDSLRKHLLAQSSRIAQALLAALTSGSLAAIAWLKSLVPDPATLVAVLRKAETLAPQVAEGLRQLYGDAAEQCGALLRTGQYSPQAIAGALKASYGLTEEAVGQLLKDIGMSANEIARGLKLGFDWSAKKTANFFKKTLKFGDQTAKKALEAAKYSESQIKGAMEDAYGWTESMWDSIVDVFT